MRAGVEGYVRWAGLIVAVFLSTQAHAEDGLTVTGSSRLRYEAIAGQPRAGFNDSDELVNLRTILTVDYRRGPWRLVGEVRDSRVWNANAATPLTTNEVNTVEPVQAFVALDLGDALGKGSSLRMQAGRFLLDLASRRLVADDDYRNTTNGFTGLRVDVGVAKRVDATFIYVLPQQRRPDDGPSLRANAVELDRESFDQLLWGGVVGLRNAVGGATLEATFYHFGERDTPGRPTRDRSLNTVGARLIRAPQPGKVDFEAEGFHQSGQIGANLAANAATLPVAAGFVHLETGYSWRTTWQPHVSFEFDWASGDQPGGRYGRFDPLFGMRRADYGPAGLYNAVARTNLLAAGLRLEVTPSKRVDAFAAYRALWLDSATDAFSTTGVRDASGASGRFAGHQVEARIRWWVMPKHLRFEANALWLSKGRFLSTAPNAPKNGNTRYASLNLTASF